MKTLKEQILYSVFGTRKRVTASCLPRLVLIYNKKQLKIKMAVGKSFILLTT